MAVSASILSLLGGLLYGYSVGKLSSVENRAYGIRRKVESFIQGGSCSLFFGFRIDNSEVWLQRCLRLPLGPSGSVIEAVAACRALIRLEDLESSDYDARSANWISSFFPTVAAKATSSSGIPVTHYNLGNKQLFLRKQQFGDDFLVPSGLLVLPPSAGGGGGGGGGGGKKGKATAPPMPKVQPKIALKPPSLRRGRRHGSSNLGAGDDSSDEEEDLPNGKANTDKTAISSKTPKRRRTIPEASDEEEDIGSSANKGASALLAAEEDAADPFDPYGDDFFAEYEVGPASQIPVPNTSTRLRAGARPRGGARHSSVNSVRFYI